MITLEETSAYQQEGYQTVPLIQEYIADDLTPITALKRLKTVHDHVFLLESASAHQHSGRYTFLSSQPNMQIHSINGQVYVSHEDQAAQRVDQALEELLEDLLAANRSPQLEGAPPLTSGLVGYFAYEFYQYLEGDLDFSAYNPDQLPEVDLMLFDHMICFDSYRHTLLIISQVDLGQKDLEAAYQQALDQIDHTYQLLMTSPAHLPTSGQLDGELEAHFSQDQFCQMVEQAQDHIDQGHVEQVVLSNALQGRFTGSLLNSYRVLRTINPSPYMVYLSSPQLEIAAASPETLANLQAGKVKTYPLAGTRPRGKNPEEDQALEADLLADTKEINEHNILIETSQKDLEKICQADSITVEDYMSVHKYSHVMHIGSCLSGQLAAGKNAVDVIKTLLPAGTLSGHPKHQAMQIILDLEQDRRDIYGGAMGYIDFSGNMDACIAIRLAYKRGDRLTIRSGAGIVKESEPHKEYQECINKAKATLQAIHQQGAIPPCK